MADISRAERRRIAKARKKPNKLIPYLGTKVIDYLYEQGFYERSVCDLESTIYEAGDIMDAMLPDESEEIRVGIFSYICTSFLANIVSKKAEEIVQSNPDLDIREVEQALSEDLFEQYGNISR